MFFNTFASPLGDCGVVWGPAGVVALTLPEANLAATLERIVRHYPEARRRPLDGDGRSVAEGIQVLLTGTEVDLSSVVLDMDRVSPFYRQVYVAARRIPVGQTATYGEVAKLVGAPHASRAVGQALGRNPYAIVVPCHRVVAAGGRLGGFSAHGGSTTKQRLLAIEQRARSGQTLLGGLL